MRKLFILLVITTAMHLVGCSSDAFVNRIWVGSLYRSSEDTGIISEDNKLSDVCLKITKDSMFIFSNAIFGSEYEQLALEKRKKNNYTFSALEREFAMQISYEMDQTTGAETLSIQGEDYHMQLHAVEETEISQSMLEFYVPVPAPPSAKLSLTGRWNGTIGRMRDNQKLSPVCIEYEPSEIHVYANAIFGTSNDTLTYKGFIRGAYYYENENGDMFAWSPEIMDDGGLVMYSDDFWMTLVPCEEEMWEQTYSLYRGEEVTRDANGYLFGTYTGKGIMRVATANALSALFGLGSDFFATQLAITLQFMDGGKCRVTNTSSLVNSNAKMLTMFGGPSTSETDVSVETYKVVGDVLFVGKSDQYKLMPDGSLLLSGREVAEKSNGKVTMDDIVLRPI